MIDPRLIESRIDEIRRLSLDWCNAYVGPAGPAGAVQAWPAERAELLGVPPLEGARLSTSIGALEPVRAVPSHQAEMISEIRRGEWLLHLHTEGSWWLVAGEDGYVGWVNGWVLLHQEEEQRTDLLARRFGRYTSIRGEIQDLAGKVSATVDLGTPFLQPEHPLPARDGMREVELVGGRRGWVEEAQLSDHFPEGSSGEILENAARLLGTPYRWGGRSPAGLDCSGFVQMIFAFSGIALPRDAQQQAGMGEAAGIDMQGAMAGDLIFFDSPATHVGILDGSGGLFHCRGEVLHQAFGEIPQLMERTSSVRRILGGKTVSAATLWHWPLA